MTNSWDDYAEPIRTRLIIINRHALRCSGEIAEGRCTCSWIAPWLRAATPPVDVVFEADVRIERMMDAAS